MEISKKKIIVGIALILSAVVTIAVFGATGQTEAEKLAEKKASIARMDSLRSSQIEDITSIVNKLNACINDIKLDNGTEKNIVACEGRNLNSGTGAKSATTNTVVGKPQS